MFYLSTFSDSYSTIMRSITSFHDTVMIVVVAIVSLVGYVFVSTLSQNWARSVESSESLEVVWTVLPCLVLAGLAAPSLLVLYLSDELSSPSLTLNVVGHQWYWSYEYSDCGEEISFDSYILPTKEVWEGGLRLLEVDNRTPVPVSLESRVLVTSSDVIHSWALPSMGVNIDAIPGRLNQLTLLPTRVGVIYGQCSEVCGANHSFIPICVEILPVGEFLSYMEGNVY